MPPVQTATSQSSSALLHRSGVSERVDTNPKIQAISATVAVKTGRISEAIRSGSIAAIKQILERDGESIHNYKSQFGTLLHLAASFGTAALFLELQQQGLDLNARSSDGSTALHIASKLGRHDLVEAVLNLEQVDDTVRDADGMTAAEVAKTKQISSLFDYARNMYQLKKTKEMHGLVHRGDLDGLERIFQVPRNQYLLDINSLDAFGDSPLHVSARNNNAQMVSLCLKLGADPFLKNKRNKLPLELARDDSIKAVLKEAPMVKSHVHEIPLVNPNIKYDGVLSKWANYAEGYKKRWFVLEDGMLSYFKSQADYPVSCRGAVTVQFCRILEHPTDKYRFEVIGLNNSIRYHLRAESVAEAKKWVIAITEAQKAPVSDIVRSSTFLNNHSADRLKDAKDAVESQIKSILDEGFGVLSQSEALLLNMCDVVTFEGASKGEIAEQVKRHLDEESIMQRRLRKLLVDIGEIDAAREAEILSMKEQLELYGNTVRDFAEENRKIELWTKNTLGNEQLSDTESVKEFYDVMELEDGADSKATFSGGKTDGRDKAIESTNLMKAPGYPIHPRTSLPVGSASMPPINLWSILKGLVGKDLFRFPLPVNFSEPLSMLQRLAEDVEYAELLGKAANDADPLMRIQYVAAFAVSCYSSTDSRVTKPFNPLLGETFEYIDRHKGFRYIAEQVSHHPPISACHCEGPGWTFWSEVNVTNKFLGKSLDITPEGWNHVVIHSTGDHYVWKKVAMSIYNLIVGKLWIDHYGTMRIENKTNGGEVCELEFKAHGWRGTNAKRVVGIVAGPDRARPSFSIDGRWHSSLTSTNLGTRTRSELWRRRPRPSNADTTYMFTLFAMALNQLDPDMTPWLCPSDSRFRPDQRAMEEGRWDDANTCKLRLEEKQRTTRKLLASQSDFVYTPRWFMVEPCKITGESRWAYVGGYWEARERADWSQVEGIPNIFL